jgi:hypothetical protein
MDKEFEALAKFVGQAIARRCLHRTKSDGTLDITRPKTNYLSLNVCDQAPPDGPRLVPKNPPNDNAPSDPGNLV